MFEDLRKARPIIKTNSRHPLFYRLFRLPVGEDPPNIKPVKVSY
jgi:hypothetical protein